MAREREALLAYTTRRVVVVVVVAAACIVLTFGANWLHDSSSCRAERGGVVVGGVSGHCVLRQASLGTFRLRNVIALS